MAKTLLASQNLWLHFHITLQLRRRLCGGIPKAPDVIDRWIDTILSDQNQVRGLLAKIRQENGLEEGDGGGAAAILKAQTMEARGVTEEDREALKKTAWNGFKANSSGLYLEGRCVKSMLKEAAAVAANALNLFALKNRVAERFFVVEDEIPLGVSQPSGSYESTVHVTDRFGNPQAALKRTDYVEAPTLEFTVKALNDVLVCKKKAAGEAGRRMFPAEILQALLSVGGELGLGAERSQGNGTFDATIIQDD